MAELLADGTKQISISREHFTQISEVLQGFYRQTKCGAVMLSDISGLLVAKSGKLEATTMALLSSVAAGNYAATNEMARLIGEPDFSGQFHEGAKNHIYVTGVDESFFLVVVFSKQTTFGMVRVLVAKTVKEIREKLEVATGSAHESQQQVIQQDMGKPEFVEELSAKLDSILFKKN